ncbi:MAG: Rieske (2Fe-2S) protein [Burkholderiales bacterium]|nr:Rieske (2Fe-2S) protein [Burkholderiales bacterium]
MTTDHPDTDDSNCSCSRSTPGSRRTLLTGALALALAPLGLPAAWAATDARRARPQPGDRLAFSDGEQKGKTMALADLKVGDPPRLAYPLDPATQTVRDGSRINLLLLVRLDPKDISEKTKPHAADGVVAYSAVCTHYGCPITLLHENKHAIVCTCHGSTFDAGNNGEILVGPATRRLAILPLKAADGMPTVAAGFIGRLGPPQE